MGKPCTDQRDRILTLARILYNETDEKHPLPLAALISRLEEAGIRSERKSLYRDLAALQRHGLEVKYRAGHDGGWYLNGRALNRNELRQVIDAVSVYRWLPEAARASLLEKLAALAPVHFRAGLRRPVLRSRQSAGEPEALQEVLDKIHAALQAGKALSFYPVEWTPEKTMRAAGGRTVVSPKGLLWEDERYALVALDHRRQVMDLFYPDRMAQVRVTGLPARSQPVNLQNWLGTPFGLDPGLRCTVRLQCHRDLAGEVLDRFGRETALQPAEDGASFVFTAEAVIGPAFWGWLTAQGNRAEVLSPLWAVKVWQERYRPRQPRGQGIQPTKAG